jgi:pimeloyl-ACP methyl ester carboxylesterase
LLEQLLLAPCVSLVSCRDRDWLERERVCVHVYRPSQFLPKPLLETPLPPPRQRRPVSFKLAYPELVLCSLPRSLVETFQYFWPLSKEEFRDFESGARIEWALPTIDGPDGMVRLREALRAYRDYLVVAGGRDLIHPGDRVAARAREVLPTLRELILVPETGHIHFEAPGGPVMKRIAGDGFSRERVAGRGVQRLSGGGGDR